MTKIWQVYLVSIGQMGEVSPYCHDRLEPLT